MFEPPRRADAPMRTDPVRRTLRYFRRGSRALVRMQARCILVLVYLIAFSAAAAGHHLSRLVRAEQPCWRSRVRPAETAESLRRMF
jgi:hypothetical protein